jgi:hypothetical protein
LTQGTHFVVDFRYHLVTIIAIFLALALGIVVGTTALNGPVLDGLRDSNSGLIGEKDGLRSEVRSLKDELTTADDFTRLLAGDLVGGQLEGQGVLLVLTPGADPQAADQLAAFLTDAGARVTGRLAVQPALLDPEQRQLVDDRGRPGRRRTRGRPARPPLRGRARARRRSAGRLGLPGGGAGRARRRG